MLDPRTDTDPGPDNPLCSEDPAAWTRLVAAVGPASMLVVIEERLTDDLRGKVSADDIWQEALMHAWRDRAQCVWDGVQSFRRWLLGIIDNRIRDTRAFFLAHKRTSRREQPILRAVGGMHSTWKDEPGRSTTPSRIAVHREQADQMRDTLADIPADLREVLRLRLFEDRAMEDVAARLGIGLSAAKHRYRKGAALYRDRLYQRLGSWSGPR